MSDDIFFVPEEIQKIGTTFSIGVLLAAVIASSLDLKRFIHVIASNIESKHFHLEVKDLKMALAGLPND